MTIRSAARVGASLVCGAALFAACAGRRPPTAKVSTADVAIREAEEVDAAQHAPLELRLAREKLEKARRAMDDEEYDRANRLSQEAFVDAQLAEAKARTATAESQAEEMQKSIEALRREAERGAVQRR
jgi:hypothetical protein